MATFVLEIPRSDPTSRDALRLVARDDRPAPLTSVGAALVRAVAAVRDGERRAMWPRVAEQCWQCVSGMG